MAARTSSRPTPHWRDHILFYESFHGDNGAGLGASHQTGWSGLVAKTIQLHGLLDTKRVLAEGKQAAFVQGASRWRKWCRAAPPEAEDVTPQQYHAPNTRRCLTHLLAARIVLLVVEWSASPVAQATAR